MHTSNAVLSKANSFASTVLFDLGHFSTFSQQFTVTSTEDGGEQFGDDPAQLYLTIENSQISHDGMTWVAMSELLPRVSIGNRYGDLARAGDYARRAGTTYRYVRTALRLTVIGTGLTYAGANHPRMLLRADLEAVR